MTIQALKQALEDLLSFGDHGLECSTRDDPDRECNCCFEEALNDLRKAIKQEEER